MFRCGVRLYCDDIRKTGLHMTVWSTIESKLKIAIIYNSQHKNT